MKLQSVLTGLLAVTLVTMAYMAYSSIGRPVGCPDRYSSLDRVEPSNRSGEDSMLCGESVSYDKRCKYNMLSFDSAEDFICSLQSTVGINGADTLYKRRVYDYDEGSLVSLFESVDGKVVVAIDSKDDSVVSCKFVGIDNDSESKIRKLIQSSKNNSGFKLKSINEGFMLEPRNTV